jgi:ABC-type multidrug transport system fused ATPase/permease subunit
VYSQPETIILDDVLSAVDAHAVEEIWRNCILGVLRKRRTTCILVTHQVRLTQDADFVVVMDDGAIAEKGSYTDLIANPDGKLSLLIQSQQTDEENHSRSESLSNVGSRSRSASTTPLALSRVNSHKSEKALPPAYNGTLVEAEEVEVGDVHWSTYIFYVTKIGTWCVLLIMLSSRVVSSALEMSSQFWLSLWADDSLFLPEEQYLSIYIMLVLSSIVVGIGAGCFFFVMSMKASFSIFCDVLDGVINSPMSFFDTNPTGRLLNRLGEDVQRMDHMVPWMIEAAVRIGLYVVLLLAMTVFAAPWFILVLLCVVPYVRAILSFYKTFALPANRLWLTTGSPVQSCYLEAYHGAQPRYSSQPPAAVQTIQPPDPCTPLSIVSPCHQVLKRSEHSDASTHS